MTDARALPDTGPELSRRLETVAAQYLVDRYCGPGNPMKTQVLRLGAVVATKVPALPRNALMNAVHGLADPADLPRVLAFYAETSQPCWVEVPPHVDRGLYRALIDRGFAPSSHKAVLYGTARRDAPCNGDAGVQRVAPGELEVFLDTLNRGFDAPEPMLAGLRRNQSFWGDVAHWRLYLARLGGEPAGAAVLAITAGLGYLAASSTLPQFRGRGVHGALLARRLADAATAGCEFVTGQADFASGSHRNQERAGLRLAHVRQDWSNG